MNQQDGRAATGQPQANQVVIAHVTHEAVEQLGGIGTVLEGLIAAPAYQQRVGRSLLIGPFEAQGDDGGLAAMRAVGDVHYASHQNIDTAALADRLDPIAQAFNTPIVFGTRRYDLPGQNRQGQADTLLIDVRHINTARVDALKSLLWDQYQLDSARHQDNWDYELWVRLAAPAVEALNTLLLDDLRPAIVFAHEFMGVPTALAAKARGRYQTIFHAHECCTARSIVENHPGHDTRFYAALNHPDGAQLSLEELFGDQSHFARHCLVRQTHHLDGVLAVGQDTAREIQRLTPAMMQNAKVHLAYNGLPAFNVTPARKEACREQLQDYAQSLTGKRPDLLITHVTRPVISKGLWRDAALLRALDPLLEAAGLTACYLLLTSARGVRDQDAIQRMEEAYGWPRHHRHGGADLVGPEAGLFDLLEHVNHHQQHTQAILINQFGFSPQRIGQRVPEGMNIADFRTATDVELGMATYEPFGISPLEPLAAGAVCVISSICGCAGLVQTVTGGDPEPNVLIADYTRPPEGPPEGPPQEPSDRPPQGPLEGSTEGSTESHPNDFGLHDALAIGQAERDRIELKTHTDLAQRLLHLVPADPQGRADLLKRGQKLVAEMTWDKAFARGIWPVLQPLVKP